MGIYNLGCVSFGYDTEIVFLLKMKTDNYRYLRADFFDSIMTIIHSMGKDANEGSLIWQKFKMEDKNF